MACSHPNILRGKDGALKCLTCGQAVEENRREAEPEKKPAKRTAKKTKAD